MSERIDRNKRRMTKWVKKDGRWIAKASKRYSTDEQINRLAQLEDLEELLKEHSSEGGVSNILEKYYAVIEYREETNL